MTEIKSNNEYYLALDGVRGYLILLVMGIHMETYIADDYFNIQWLFDGKIAVDIFLVISGFLITRMLYLEVNLSKQISLKAFYVRRVFRLLPVFLLTIIIYLMVGLIVPGQEAIYTRTMDSLPYHLTMRSEYIPESVNKSIGHAWSLSLEEKFYLIWPALIFVVFKKNLRAIIHVLPFLAMPLFLQDKLYYSYLALVIGSYLGFVMSEDRTKKEGLFYHYAGTNVFGYVSFTLFTLSYIVFTHSCDYTEKLFILIPIALCVLHLICGNSIIVRFFSHRYNVFVGKKAYAMYLLHMVVVTGVQTKLIKADSNLNIIITLFISYLLILIVATIVYKVVEKPMIIVGKKLSNQIKDTKKLI